MSRTLPAALAALLFAPAAAFAHFPFLSVTGENRLRLTFGENADADDEQFLPITRRIELVRRTPDGAAAPVALTPEGGVLTADVSADPAGTVYTFSMPYGVTDRGDGPFLLEYHGAAMKEKAPGDTGRPAAVNAQPLAVVPEPGGALRVLAAGVPAAGAEVNAAGDLTNEDLVTKADGSAKLPAESLEDGSLSVRAKVVVPGAGVYEGDGFTETRRYATAVLSSRDFTAADEVSDGGETADAAVPENQFTVAEVPGAALPEGVSSLGAAVSDGYIYYYGGHPGTAHKYSTDEQSGKFRRLNLADPDAGWEELPGGPKLQGLALVPHPAGGVVRIGGFTARNSLEEEHDLHSMPTVAHYDPAKGEWVPMPPLPGGRSSFDAVLSDETIYVLGGWMMAGLEGEAWHGTALKLDLSADEPAWETLPMPRPRRALAAAAAGGKVYMIGGMTPEGEPVRRVDILDAAAGGWSEGPALAGDMMDGFGAAAYAADGAVYAATLSGKLQRLTPGADEWEVLGELENPRFFHRLLPAAGEGQSPTFYLLGGGNMTDGRYELVEKLTVGG